MTARVVCLGLLIGAQLTMAQTANVVPLEIQSETDSGVPTPLAGGRPSEVDASPLEAGTEDLQGLMDTGVVSGPSRTDERLEDAPATVTIVTAAELRRYGIRWLSEALNFLSVGMMSQDTLHGPEVGARGVTISGDFGTHMLVVVDGNILNEAWNGTATYEAGHSIPIEFIDHLELSVGPGSVMYGSSAMLGVINVVTKRARDLGTLQLTVEGAAMPPRDVNGNPELRWPGFGGTGRASLLTGLEGTLLGKTIEASLALEYFGHRGESLTFAQQTGLTETDGMTTWPLSFGARAGEAGTWGGQTTDSWWTQRGTGVLKVKWGDFSLWARAYIHALGHPAIDVTSVAANFDGHSYESSRYFNTELRWQRALTSRLSLLARVYFDGLTYYSQVHASAWTTFGSGEAPPDGTDVQNFTFRLINGASALWGGAEVQASVDWLGDGRFPLIAGVDGRLKTFGEYNRYALPQDDGPIFQEGPTYQQREWLVAGYLQQRARILPSLQANVGIRVDAQSGFAARPTPRAAVTWTTPWEGRVKAIVSTAFRTPSGYERFSEIPGLVVRNLDLRPETSLTGELIYEQRFGRHRIMVGGFATKYSDLVQWAAVPTVDMTITVYSRQNIVNLTNVGGQARVEGALGSFSYAASFTGAVNSTTISMSPGWFGNARIGWTFGEDGPRASLLAHFSGSRAINTFDQTGVAADGSPLTWAVGADRSSAQTELRAVVEGNIKQVPGLWIRGVVGGQAMPFSGYLTGPRQAPEEGFTTPPLTPNSNRLFGMLTIGWTLEKSLTH